MITRCSSVGRLVTLVALGRGLFALVLGVVGVLHQLGYESQQVVQWDRLTLKADKIRARLGLEAGILNGTGWKPKGMHWRTYWRLYAEHERLVGGICAAMNQRFKLGLDDPLRFDP
jgi:hypothetical protein